VGALAAVSGGLGIGLGIAVDAHRTGAAARIVWWQEFGLAPRVFSVFGAFLSFVVGGWVTARVADLRRSAPAMVQAAVVWALSVPFLLVLASLGAGGYFGEGYVGLAGSPASGGATVPVDPEAARFARNAALGAVTGGWMASGAPNDVHILPRARTARALCA
jgi:hypothetical protein